MKINNYIFHIIILITAFISIIYFTSCESPVEPIELDNPSIVFETSGGFWGVFHKLSIDNSGLATYESIYPPLQLQLSEEELASIKSDLNNFDNYQDSYPGGCIDDFHYKISLITDKRSKTVEFDGCSIEKYSELKELANLTSALGQLRVRIYNEKATWEGLSYLFSINNSEYSQSDTIKFSCKIINSTDNERCIYFRSKYRIQVAIHNDTHDPHIQFWIPDYSIAMTDTTSPSKIILNPNEEKVVTNSWDQVFTNFDNVSYTELPKGSYTARIHLLGGFGVNDGHPISDYIIFEIK